MPQDRQDQRFIFAVEISQSTSDHSNANDDALRKKLLKKHSQNKIVPGGKAPGYPHLQAKIHLASFVGQTIEDHAAPKELFEYWIDSEKVEHERVKLIARPATTGELLQNVLLADETIAQKAKQKRS